MNCLYCYTPLEPGQQDFHPACSRKLFGKDSAPALPYDEAALQELAAKQVITRIAVTGVQAKLSLHLESASKNLNQPARFTIVGLWGEYILKPPSQQYPYLPELEDCTLHMARIAGMDTVPHSLIRMQGGELAYITKRIDRQKKRKLAMEDLCQLTGRLTEDKYKGSYEQIRKVIIQYSSNPALDLVSFYGQLLFSFLTGNADMHLKNFSLIEKPGLGYVLAPAYDMVPTALIMPNDTEEMALNFNGKKRKIQRKDFDQFFSASPLVKQRSIDNMYTRMQAAVDMWMDFIPHSFLPESLQEEYSNLIRKKAKQIAL